MNLKKTIISLSLFVLSLSLFSFSSAQSTNDEDDVLDFLPAIIAAIGRDNSDNGPPPPPPPPPAIENILLIIADDLGVDNISVYGEHSQAPSTPTIDQLAAEGILFQNAWVNPSCAPTRGALMTGRYAFRNGATHPNSGQNVLDANEITIAEVISEAGYQTALFGKWHLGNGNGANQGTLPTDQGFDHFSGHINGNIRNYSNWDKTTLTGPGQPNRSVDETGYATEVNTQEAVSWINATTSPYLAIVSYAAPHDPFHVPPAGRFTINLTGNPGDICTGATQDDCYRAMIQAMDSYINDLLTQINPAKLANTLIIFMGDNGTPTQVTIDEGTFRTDHAKGSAYQGGVRVPFIVAGGSNLNIANTELTELVDITDLFSTFIDIAGAEEPDNVTIDGRSILGLIDPAIPAPAPREYQFAESIDGDIDQWAISDGMTKFIFDSNGIADGGGGMGGMGGMGGGTGGCYDLISDPGELDPTSGDQTTCDALEAMSPRSNP